MDMARKFSQWIQLPSDDIVSCATCVLSLLSLSLFEINAIFMSTICLYFFQQILQVYRLFRRMPQKPTFHQNSISNSEMKKGKNSTFDLLPVELSDVIWKFYKRRHSYPLQISEKLTYTLEKMRKTPGTNFLFCDKAVENKGDLKTQKSTNILPDIKLSSKTVCARKSYDLKGILHRCIKGIDDAIEHLKILSVGDTSTLQAQQKINSNLLSSAKNSKKEIEETSGRHAVPGSKMEHPVIDIYNDADVSEDLIQEVLLFLKHNSRSATNIKNYKPVNEVESITNKIYDFSKMYNTLNSENKHGISAETNSKNIFEKLSAEKSESKEHDQDLSTMNQNIAKLPESQTKSPAVCDLKVIKTVSEFSKFNASSTSCDYPLDLSKCKKGRQRQSEACCLSNSKDYKGVSSRSPQCFSKGMSHGIILVPSKLEKQMQQKSGTVYLPISPDKKAKCSQHDSNGITLGIISDQYKLEKELAQPKVNFLQHKQINSSVIRKVLGLSKLEKCRLGFVFNRAIKQLGRTYVSHVRDNISDCSRQISKVIDDGFLDTDKIGEERADSEIQDIEQQIVNDSSSKNIETNSGSSPKCSKADSRRTVHHSEISLPEKEFLEQPESFTDDNKTASRSSGTISTIEHKNFILDNSKPETELKDSENQQKNRADQQNKKRAVDNNISTNSLQHNSKKVKRGMILDSVKYENQPKALSEISRNVETQYRETEEQFKQKFKMPLSHRFRKSFKIVTCTNKIKDLKLSI